MHLTLLLDLPADSTAPCLARRAVRSALAADSRLPDPSDLLLVVSELVTNALVHGSGPLCLQLLVGDDVVEVAVADTSPADPRVLPASRSAESGRGMALVTACASTWGVEAQPSGKRVWARFSSPDEVATPA